MQERTIEPTPRRLREARRHGQVARSRLLAAAVITIGGVGALGWVGERLVDSLSLQIRDAVMSASIDPLDAADVQAWFGSAAGRLVSSAGWLLLCVVAVGLTANIMQTGFVFAPKRLAPDVRRLWLAGPRAPGIGSGAIQVIGISCVTAWFLSGRAAKFARLHHQEPAVIVTAIGAWVIELGLWIGLAMLILAIPDLLQQRRRHFNQLKMTPAEFREEMRATQSRAGNRGREQSPSENSFATNPISAADFS